MIALKVSLFTQLLRGVGHARMQVTGCSMLPVIHPGDVIRVEAGAVEVGDVVVFNRDGYLCAHRLLAVVEGNALARGDANRKFDTLFPASEILGKVTSVSRNDKVLTDLSFRRFMSFFIRNLVFAPRIYLKAVSIRRRILGPEQQSLTPTSTKSEA